jgi:hypothetical protein
VTSNEQPRYLRAIAAFGKFPGVVGIGSCLKGPQRTPALQVMVRRKRSLAELPHNERIPSVFEGIPTDVWEEPPSIAASQGSLTGGAQVSSTSGYGGTLGCFATRGSSVVLLTAGHVLFFATSAIGTGGEVGAPDIGGCCCCRSGVVATTLDGRIDTSLDCGIALLNGARPTQQMLPGLGPASNGQDADLILGVSPKKTDPATQMQLGILPGDKVRKVGARTGPTGGTVGSITLALPAFQDLPAVSPAITIIPDPDHSFPDPDGKYYFCNEGDSGSVIVDVNNMVAALLIRAVDLTNQIGQAGITAKTGYGGGAIDIYAVQSAMNINIFTSFAKQQTGQARGLAAGARIQRWTDAGEPARWREGFATVRRELSTFDLGRRVVGFAEKHEREITRLINHNRRVTVAWHRAQGPAFAARLLRDFHGLDQPIPPAPDDATLTDGLRSMRDVFGTQGSPALAADAAALWTVAERAVPGSATLGGLIDNLRSLDAHEH